MAQKRKTDQSQLIAEAALCLADTKGWARLSLSDVAKKAKVPLKTVTSRFKNSWQILSWVLQKIDADVQTDVRSRLGDNWRDNLFEILMTRFDLAQRHRGAFSSIIPSLAENPRAARHFVRTFYKTSAGMMDLAGVPGTTCTPLHLAAFGVLYLSLVHTWSQDETRDLSRTMAAADQRLQMFDKAVSLKFFS